MIVIVGLFAVLKRLSSPQRRIILFWSRYLRCDEFVSLDRRSFILLNIKNFEPMLDQRRVEPSGPLLPPGGRGDFRCVAPRQPMRSERKLLQPIRACDSFKGSKQRRLKLNKEKATGFRGRCPGLHGFSCILLYLSLIFSANLIKGNIATRAWR